MNPTPATAGRPQRRVLVYALALAAAIAGIAIRQPFEPVLGHRAVFLFFVPATLFATGIGGAGPAALAGLVGLAAGLHILGGDGLDTADVLNASVFGMLAIGIAAGGERLQRMRAHVEQTTAELQQREAHLRSILDTVPDAMIVIDERGVMQSFSSAAERLFGWSAEEAIGRNVAVLMPSPYREQHDAYLHHYLGTGERRIIGIGRVVVGERRDGSTFPMELAVGEMVSSGQRNSPASSAIFRSARRPRRGSRNCSRSWSTSRASPPWARWLPRWRTN